jgi:undecaprenyl diphosphate synthase
MLFIPMDPHNIPKHIAIIMDGNRRWARSHKLPDIKGHEAGAENLEKIVEAAAKLGVKAITVYALSTENIKERAKREVGGL